MRYRNQSIERYLTVCLQKINLWKSASKKILHVCNERTRFSVSWKSFFNGVSRQEKDLFHRLYPHYIVYIQFTHTRNFQVDGWRSKENLFGQSVLLKNTCFSLNHHGAEISVIRLVERSGIKLLILIRY